MAEITAEYLRSVLHYDPSTGVFTWRERPRDHFKNEQAHKAWNTKYSGKTAGTDSRGYVKIIIDYVQLRAHRLAWLYVTGNFPPDIIDHIDMNRKNNSFSNLRISTVSQNGMNRPVQSNSSSKIKCIKFDSDRSTWRVFVQANGVFHRRRFKCLGMAIKSRNSALLLLHGEFARIT